MTQNPHEIHWHSDDAPMAPGCLQCPDLKVCGGLRSKAGLSSCQDLCRCNAAQKRNVVCGCNARDLVCRLREVNGWELDVPKVPKGSHADVSLFAPMIYGRCGRDSALLSETVAIPLSRLFSLRTGRLNVKTRADICRQFLLDPRCQIILSGVHYDETLERYWSLGRRNDIVEAISQLGFDVITTPNFSLFPDVSRWDNLHNMKRIAICWQELAATGKQTALHVNARTPRDYERWREFIVGHDEISTIATEFQTGAASPVRGRWHAGQLLNLSARVNRPLDLIIFGGRLHLKELTASFRRVTHVSSTPYLRSVKQWKLRLDQPRRESWIRIKGKCNREELFTKNLAAYSSLISSLVA